MDLFSSEPIAQPLAARLRATNLDEYVGQQHCSPMASPCVKRWSRVRCIR